MLLLLSIAVISGIYGYHILMATKDGDDLALASPRPAAQMPLTETAPLEEPVDETPPQEKPADTKPLDSDDSSDFPDINVSPPSIAIVSEPIEPNEEIAQVEDRPDGELAVVEDDEPPGAIDDEIAATNGETMPDADAENLADTANGTPPDTTDEEVAAVNEEEFLQNGWKTEATEVLRGFMAATGGEERSLFLLSPDRISRQLRAIQNQSTKPWEGLLADDFKHIDLSEADRRNGIFLMTHETLAEDPDAPPHRSYAFFKRTSDGLKLDLETFIQTTGHTFQRFIETPQPGISRVFRVFITADPSATSPANQNSFIIAGLSNLTSATRIRVSPQSPVGKILTATNFTSDDGARRIMRNATVELRWTDHPENSMIELSRFICWEFLGLGGQPVDDEFMPQW